MEIDFNDPKHKALVEDYEALCKEYDHECLGAGRGISEALLVLANVNTFYDVIPILYLRPHRLYGDYDGHFAVDATEIHRVIFRPNHDNDPKFNIDDYKTIKAIIIVEIFKDYHRKI